MFNIIVHIVGLQPTILPGGEEEQPGGEYTEPHSALSFSHLYRTKAPVCRRTSNTSCHHLGPGEELMHLGVEGKNKHSALWEEQGYVLDTDYSRSSITERGAGSLRGPHPVQGRRACLKSATTQNSPPPSHTRRDRSPESCRCWRENASPSLQALLCKPYQVNLSKAGTGRESG